MKNRKLFMRKLKRAPILWTKIGHRIFVALCVTCLSNPVMAQAELSLNSVNARADTVVSVPLNISDSPVSAGFNVELNFPAGTSVSNVSSGSMLDGSFSFNHLADAMQNLRIIGYSSTSTFSGGGQLADVQLQISADTLPGFYPMAISATNPEPNINSRYALASDDGLVSLPVSATNANLFVYSYSSDFDGDQLPDNWEIANGLSHLVSTGDSGTNGDMDGDGIGNLDEYRAGTDPADGQDSPEVGNGVNYVYFRDHFNDEQYLDRWFVGVVDATANYSLFEETITDPGGDVTVVDIDVAKPVTNGDCDQLFLQSIATVDMVDGVYVAHLHPFGFGTTSIGLSANGDLATRFELKFDSDQAPYLTIRSFENNVEIANAGLTTVSYLDDDIEVRMAKSGNTFIVYVNGIIQSAAFTNATLGNTSLQPFIAAESCFADTAAVDTYIESIELLRDSDGDGLADLHEDRDLNGVMSEGESDLFSPDTDGDFRMDGFDNCTLIANTLQIDYDADGYGNFCDLDFDNSCSSNFLDYGNLTSNFGSDNAPQYDIDSNGFINFLDIGKFPAFFGKPPGPSGVISTCD